MEELLNAIVNYLSNQSDIVNEVGIDQESGYPRIGAYVGDIPQMLPYLSVRFGPTKPVSDSNIQFHKTLVLLTAHSTNVSQAAKIIDFVKKLTHPPEIRGYMNVSDDRITNPQTMLKRRWYGQKADGNYDKDSDVWMDMLEVEMFWSSNACRSNPHDLPVIPQPEPQDERTTGC